MAKLLEVRGLTTRFRTERGAVMAVDDVSFDVDAGETLAIVGESGSGKSVTALSLMRLIPNPPGEIVAGSVMFEGRDLLTLSDAEMQAVRGDRIAMIFQEPMTSLNPSLTVGLQVGEPVQLHRGASWKAALERAGELLSRVRIPDAKARVEAYPHQFSGGMRQRAMIAMALACQPKLIIADEPTTALDVSIQAQILVEIGALVRELGTALLWISHDLATVSALASRLLVMYAGRIVEDGPIAEVLRAPRHPYTRGLLGSMPQFAQPGERLAQITGTPPSLAALPSGCAFSPRCNLASPQCSAGAPERSEQGARGWRCHHPLTESPR